MKYSVIILILFFSCKNTSETNINTTVKREKSITNTTSCQLIEKEFTNKAGKSTGIKELYLRCSIQDYFIKICESDITSEQLKPYLNNGIEVEMEIKEGLYDNCHTTTEQVQSRIGTYVIIKKIVK